MTRLLEEAFRKASTLPAADQDILAAAILADLEDDRRWRDTFTRSSDLLLDLAAEAREEHRAGRSVELDPERM